MVEYKEINSKTPSKEIHKFLKIQKSKTPTVILYYADWCGHCHDFKPIYDAVCNYLSKTYKGKLNLYCIEDNALKTLSNEDKFKEDSIEGYPTVICYPKTNSDKIKYDGKRNKNPLIKWIKHHTGIRRLNIGTNRRKTKNRKGVIKNSRVRSILRDKTKKYKKNISKKVRFIRDSFN